jgi:ribonuclease BN (tRNA processing enzyme)
VKGKKISLLALGRERPIGDLERIFSVQMQQEYFPVQLADMGADFEFLLPDRDVQILPKALVVARKHQHPGCAYSYRISRGAKSIVVCTDIEHGTVIDPDIVELCRGADLLLHDAQYTPEELANRRGWGHSSYEQAIECAQLAKVKKLVLTHHDPDHDDDFLDEIERRSQELLPGCVLARENMTLTV